MNTIDFPFKSKYPNNLIQAIIAKKPSDLPGCITKDMHAGLAYALSTLEENEYTVIRLLFMDENGIDIAARKLSVTEDACLLLVNSALRKLRLPGRWNYIRHGIAGYARIRMCEQYRKGYHNGYWDGYQYGTQSLPKEKPISTCSDELWDKPIEMLGLSSQALNCLRRHKITQIHEVAALKSAKIASMRNLGPKRASEIAAALQEHGIEHTDWNRYLP